MFANELLMIYKKILGHLNNNAYNELLSKPFNVLLEEVRRLPSGRVDYKYRYADVTKQNSVVYINRPKLTNDISDNSFFIQIQKTR